MVSGASASGKTRVCRELSARLSGKGEVAFAKMECVSSDDAEVFRNAGVPAVTGISGDICPDHYLVSNLPELWKWAEGRRADWLLIESAGLCHRCSPATSKCAAVFVSEATSSLKAPSSMGPMLTMADAVVVTKCDLVSQAEREIIRQSMAEVNPKAEFFFTDASSGLGFSLLASWIASLPPVGEYEGDTLRQTMPGGVCSYCVGERRVGSDFQLGVVAKIDTSEELQCGA